MWRSPRLLLRSKPCLPCPCLTCRLNSSQTRNSCSSISRPERRSSTWTRVWPATPRLEPFRTLWGVRRPGGAWLAAWTAAVWPLEALRRRPVARRCSRRRIWERCASKPWSGRLRTSRWPVLCPVPTTACMWLAMTATEGPCWSLSESGFDRLISTRIRLSCIWPNCSMEWSHLARTMLSSISMPKRPRRTCPVMPGSETCTPHSVTNTRSVSKRSTLSIQLSGPKWHVGGSQPSWHQPSRRKYTMSGLSKTWPASPTRRPTFRFPCSSTSMTWVSTDWDITGHDRIPNCQKYLFDKKKVPYRKGSSTSWWFQSLASLPCIARRLTGLNLCIQLHAYFSGHAAWKQINWF